MVQIWACWTLNGVELTELLEPPAIAEGAPPTAAATAASGTSSTSSRKRLASLKPRGRSASASAAAAGAASVVAGREGERYYSLTWSEDELSGLPAQGRRRALSADRDSRHAAVLRYVRRRAAVAVARRRHAGSGGPAEDAAQAERRRAQTGSQCRPPAQEALHAPDGAASESEGPGGVALGAGPLGSLESSLDAERRELVLSGHDAAHAGSG